YEEAEDQANYDQPLSIMGSDIDHRSIEIAKQNAIEAGFSDLITWKQMQIKDVTLRQDNGYIVCNPPYGERLSDKQSVINLYRDFGKVVEDHPSWSIYVLTAFR